MLQGLGLELVWGWVQDTDTLGGVSRVETLVLVTEHWDSGTMVTTGVFHGMVVTGRSVPRLRDTGGTEHVSTRGQ